MKLRDWGGGLETELGLRVAGELPGGAEGYTYTGEPGLGRRVSGVWGDARAGRGSFWRASVSRQGRAALNSQGDGRFVPADGRERKFDAWCPRPILEDTSAHDTRGVFYKLLLVVWEAVF